MNNLPQRIGQYTFVRDVIGSGAFALVVRGHLVDNPSDQVAIKAIAKKNLCRHSNLLEKETRILKELTALKHKNLVALLHCEENDTHVFLVMEYCNAGDLADFLQSQKKLNESTIKIFLRQIAEALKVIHSCGIVHRDLKPQNILMCLSTTNDNEEHHLPENYILKIADFGFARFLKSGVMAGTLCGSPMYMAPEVLMSLQYDGKADLWSIGTIVYQCLVGNAPFQARSPPILRHFYERNSELKPKIPSNASIEFTDLVRRLLCKNPKQRLSLTGLLNHDFLSNKKPSLVHKSSIFNIESTVTQTSEQNEFENFEIINREECNSVEISMNKLHSITKFKEGDILINSTQNENDQSVDIPSFSPTQRFQQDHSIPSSYNDDHENSKEDLDFSFLCLSSSVFHIPSLLDIKSNNVRSAFAVASINESPLDTPIFWKAPILRTDRVLRESHNVVLAKIVFIRQVLCCILVMISKKSNPLLYRSRLSVKSEIFVLSLKCMELINDVISLIKNEINNGKLKSSLKVISYVKDFQNWYKQTLSIVTKLSKFMSNNYTNLKLPDANQLIFVHTLETCMNAVCDEYFEQQQPKCASMYQECQILLHLLCQQCPGHKDMFVKLREGIEERLQN